MSLISPGVLVLAVLAVPMVVSSIGNVSQRSALFSLPLFWQSILRRISVRQQRLHRGCSLLLQLLFVGLLIFAVTDPVARWQDIQSQRIVVVVDNSASMNADDVSPTRLGAAKTKVLHLIDGLRLGDEMAIVAAAAHPRVACGLTGQVQSLQAAVDSIEPLDGPTRVEQAIALARRLVSGFSRARVVVVTDGAFDRAADIVRADDITLIDVGKRTGNIGITRLDARRSQIAPAGYEVIAEVANASDAAASIGLELKLGAQPIGAVALNLCSGETREHVFATDSAAGGRLRAALDRADSLAADDNAWAILPRIERVPVRLVTPGNPFLEAVFKGIPAVDLSVVKSVAAAPVVAPPGAGDELITVFDREIPDALPSGPLVVIDPERSSRFWALGPLLKSPTVAKLDRKSALLRNVELENVVLPGARSLHFESSAQVLAATADGEPLFALLDRGDAGAAKVAILTVDVARGGRELKAAFPVLVSNLLQLLQISAPAPSAPIATGESAELALKQAVKGAIGFQLIAPDGRRRLIDAYSGSAKVTVGTLERAGIWTVVRTMPAGGEEVVAEWACNLSDRRESDLRKDAGFGVSGIDSAWWGAVRPIWYFLLAYALALSCWEWFLYQKKRIE